jgi:hypothetical protein
MYNISESAIWNFNSILSSGGTTGYALAQLGEALRYKPEGGGFEFR